MPMIGSYGLPVETLRRSATFCSVQSRKTVSSSPPKSAGDTRILDLPSGTLCGPGAHLLVMCMPGLPRGQSPFSNCVDVTVRGRRGQRIRHREAGRRNRRLDPYEAAAIDAVTNELARAVRVHSELEDGVQRNRVNRYRLDRLGGGAAGMLDRATIYGQPVCRHKLRVLVFARQELAVLRPPGRRRFEVAMHRSVVRRQLDAAPGTHMSSPPAPALGGHS
jgi:hypothetical protein